MSAKFVPDSTLFCFLIVYIQMYVLYIVGKVTIRTVDQAFPFFQFSSEMRRF